MPIMFVFMGLTFLTNARDCYDKGSKKDAMIFVGVAIFVYVVTERIGDWCRTAKI